MACAYHNCRHSAKDIANADGRNKGHLGCYDHGHCLNPVQCPLSAGCPTQAPGYDGLAAQKAHAAKVERWLRSAAAPADPECKCCLCNDRDDGKHGDIDQCGTFD
jgi:hypothetical protein